MTAPVRFPLYGELLPPKETIDVVLALHPLKQDREIIKLPAGWSIAEIADWAEREKKATGLKTRLFAHLGGDPIGPELWHRIRLKPGATLLLRAVPGRGSGGIIKSVLAIGVAVLATAITGGLAAPLFGAAFAAGTIGAGLLGAGVLVGGTLLANSLFPVRPPLLSSPKVAGAASGGSDVRSVTYSIGGGRNESDPYGPVPVILGTHRFAPKYGGLPYTEFNNDEQYLRMLFVLGYGPLSFDVNSTAKIGETSLSSFDDVETDTEAGTVSNGDMRLYPNTVITQDMSVDIRAENGWHLITSAADADEIQIDFVAPNGIFKINPQTGTREYHEVPLKAEFRLVGGGSWSLFDTLNLKSRGGETLRRSMRRAVARGQYEINIAKDRGDDDDTDTSEVVILTAVRSYRETTTITFPKPLARIALRIRGSSQLSGTVDTFNLIASSRCKAFNGTTWVDDQVTNYCSDLFRYVLQHPANAKPETDSRIDLVALEEWWAECVARGYRFNMVRDYRSSVADVLDDICAAGRAVRIFRDGKWSVAWDNPEAPVVDHYTPRNSWGFSSKRVYQVWPHAFRCRFINEDKGYLQDEYVVYDDGYDSSNATEFSTLEFPGVTDPDLIYKHARFHIAQLRLRPEIYQLTVDAQHLVGTRGDRVRVTHDVPMWGLVPGRVKAVSGQDITLDEPVIMEDGTVYAIRFRLNDGSTLIRLVVNDPDVEQRTVTLSGSGDVPEVGDLFMFGEQNSETVVLRIRSITPGSDLTATLTLVDDAPEISQADTGTIPTFDSRITIPPDPWTLAPHSLTHVERIYRDFSGLVLSILFSWQDTLTLATERFEIEVRDNDGDETWRPVGIVNGNQRYIEVSGLDDGSWSFRVRSLFADGKVSAWATYNAGIDGLNVVPPDVENFRISVQDDRTTLSWNPVNSPSLSHYTIKFSPEISGAAWGSAATLVPRVDGTSIQVQTAVGTFLIKAVTLAEVESANAVSIINEIEGLRGLNVVEIIEPAPDWLGTHEATEVVSDALQLVGTKPFTQWGPFSTWRWRVATEGLYTVDETLDLGDVYTSRVSFVIGAEGANVLNTMASWISLASVASLAGANSEQWRAVVEIRYTSDDPNDSPVAWSEWSELVIGDYVARAYQARLRLFSDNPVVTPVIHTLSITIDMPDRNHAEHDLTIPVLGLRVNFDPPFRHLEGIGVAMQDMETGDHHTITNKDETGFDIIAHDADGVAVERTFDYIAKGYGRVLQ